MTVQFWTDFFCWCSIINFSILILWSLGFVFAKNFIYQIHGKIFSISLEQFNYLNYMLMGIFKLLVFLFNIIPFIALKLIVSNS